MTERFRGWKGRAEVISVYKWRYGVRRLIEQVERLTEREKSDSEISDQTLKMHDCGCKGMTWQETGIRRQKHARKGGFKTDERQDEERQSTLNKLSRNWNWSTMGPEKSKPDFVRGRRRA